MITSAIMVRRTASQTGLIIHANHVAGRCGGTRVFRNTPLDDGYGSALENNGQDYMLDLPALYLDYNKGPLWLRVGNQQIAWGEALFFRVFDVVQGLDLRRHSVLGVAAEEYSDSRIPSPAIRGSYRFDNGWELEGYAQQFRPSILPRPGTPYSLVAEAFTVYEEPGYAQDEDDIDVGFRYSGQWNDFDLSFMAVSRTAPRTGHIVGLYPSKMVSGQWMLSNIR